MPTYAYACKDCEHGFETQQSFSDDSLTVCPECTGTLRKKFNTVGVVFKGSGFYRTDSRDSKTSTAPAAKKPAESAASGSVSGSTNGSATGSATPTASTSKSAAASD